VDNQKKESSEIKTHEEIMILFKSLESMEEKVKNPELSGEELFKSEEILQEVERPTQIPTEVVEKPQRIEPVDEISPKKKERRKRSPLFKHERREQPAEKKINRLSFWKKVTINELEPEVATKGEHQLQNNKPTRSTFILQFDGNGNLVGLPVKKLKLETGKKGWFFFRRKGQAETGEQPEEEPVKGIKGKLIRAVSKLRQKKSSEGESGVGIGGKIKGIFRRKSKE
jgi:hypothetical protein